MTINTHTMRRVPGGYGHLVCKNCTLDEFVVDLVKCTKRTTFICGTAMNGLTKGRCVQTFASREAASDHYAAEHMTQAQRDDYEAYKVAHAERMRTERGWK